MKSLYSIQKYFLKMKTAKSLQGLFSRSGDDFVNLDHVHQPYRRYDYLIPRGAEKSQSLSDLKHMFAMATTEEVVALVKEGKIMEYTKLPGKTPK